MESYKGSSVSERIKKLFEDDQTDRIEAFSDPENPKTEALFAKDAARIAQAEAIYQNHQEGKFALTPDDLYGLAMVFQHGQQPENYKTAMELATSAEAQGHKLAGWLAAAAEDRYLIAIGEKQKWGTQFQRSRAYEWELAPMASDEESGVTDAMRAAREIPPRSEQLATFLKEQE